MSPNRRARRYAGNEFALQLASCAWIDAPGGNGSRSVVTSLDHAAFPAICARVDAILCGARQKL
jgi:hypothetical protein